MGGEIVSGPALNQRGCGRAEFVEKIAKRTALPSVERNACHVGEVYGAIEARRIGNGNALPCNVKPHTQPSVVPSQQHDLYSPMHNPCTMKP